MGSSVTRTVSHLRDTAAPGCQRDESHRLVSFLTGINMTPEQKKSNLKLALTLASVVLVFFVGFMAKSVFLGP